MNKKRPRYFQWLTILFLLLFSIPTLGAEILPQFFGLYLRTGEQIIELQASTVKGGGLSSLIRIAVSTSAPSLILYHDQHSPHNLQLTQLHYTFRTGEQGKWMSTWGATICAARTATPPKNIRWRAGH